MQNSELYFIVVVVVVCLSVLVYRPLTSKER